MFFKVFKDVARPQWFAIIDTLKRSTGLAVPELAEALEMSYMGVKKHCDELEKRGYLDTWRKAKEVGRPEKIYRLTKKADQIFPGVGDDFIVALLDATEANFGTVAAEKILFGYFQERTAKLTKRADAKSILDRATLLAKLRNEEGYFSECQYEASEGLKIVEYHNPLQVLFDRYESLVRMEESLFEKVLGAPVSRSEERTPGKRGGEGLRRITFTVATL